jgi:ribosome-associated protein
MAPTLPSQPDPDAPPPGRVRLAPGVEIAEGALDYSFTTSGGPGGQNVNKVATRCRLRVRLADLPMHADALQRLATIASALITDAGEILITCGESRSASMNRETCLERLSDLVKRALVRPKVRRPTKPSRGAKERRIGEKKRRGEIKKSRRETE